MKLHRLGNKLLTLNNRHFFLLDAVIFLIVPLLGIILRLENFANLREYQYGLLVATIVFPIIKLSLFVGFGFYKRYWRYASIDELTQIATAIVAAVILEIVFLSILEYLIEVPGYLAPRSLPLLDGLLSFILVCAIRFSVRAVERAGQRNKNFYKRDRVLIVGGGNAGVSILQEMQRNPKLGFNPIAFIDDDPQKLGLSIRGIPVVGNHYQIPEIVASLNIRKVVIAMPTASGKVIREIVDVCQAIGIQANTMPALHEVLNNSAKFNSVREVKIEDLLRREPIETDAQSVFKFLEGKTILISGAGGSIGSELCRQIFRCRPAQMILVGHGENSVFNVRQELEQVLQILRQEEQSDRLLTELVPYIADMRFKARLENAFKQYQPDLVFHAAAHKHVPLMELNPPEAITNNILGTKNLLDLAIQYDVKNFVMISTDKAVNPTNVMGASKRVAEMLVLKAAKTSSRAFVVVRFGNVLGSRGSVVPTFKQQIAKGGPVTITHPEICRYFMTIPEAVQLVLQAAVLSSEGQIFMLNMGQPVKIVDLAKDLIHLSGYEVGKDIEIVFTGLRPGEKLYEELLIPGEEYQPTPHQKVLVVKNASRIIPENLDLTVKMLDQAAQKNDINLILFLLDRLVAGYTPKYQQIEVAKAQNSLEKLITETCALNSTEAQLQTDTNDRLNLPIKSTQVQLTDQEWEQGLRQAIENQEFTLYYQPVFALHTRNINEFEALIRWHHPQLGLIAPSKFISIAEKTGLIAPIGRWIVESACRQLQTWQQEFTRESAWSISINISSRQLLQPSLVKHIQYNLNKYQIIPQNLKLEIAEHLIVASPYDVMEIIPQLGQLGIKLQIDNFGRVASLYGHFQPSLLYQEFARVKIDRMLINRIDKDVESWETFRNLVSSLERSGLEIIATGIETANQLDRLTTLDCSYGQGYYLAKPLSEEAVLTFVSTKIEDSLIGENSSLK